MKWERASTPEKERWEREGEREKKVQDFQLEQLGNGDAITEMG